MQKPTNMVFYVHVCHTMSFLFIFAITILCCILYISHILYYFVCWLIFLIGLTILFPRCFNIMYFACFSHFLIPYLFLHLLLFPLLVLVQRAGSIRVGFLLYRYFHFFNILIVILSIFLTHYVLCLDVI